MSSLEPFLIPGILLVIGVAIGELLYRRREGGAHTLGNLMQFGYAIFMFAAAISLLMVGGLYAVVGFVMVVYYFWIGRARFRKSKQAAGSLRRRLMPDWP